MAHTQISDIIVPRVFANYFGVNTEYKTSIFSSGAVVRSEALENMLQGGGKTFDVPFWNDLDNDAENVASDAQSDLTVASFAGGTPASRNDAVPNKITAGSEVASRFVRNNWWSAANLTAELAGSDPVLRIRNRINAYWARRYQIALIELWKGIIAMNIASPAGNSTHVAGDMVADISGGSFVDGTTNFSSGAFLDALLLMGDSMEDLGLMIVHSVVYHRMQNLNLIETVFDTDQKTTFSAYQGRRVIVNDNVPVNGNIYDTLIFGRNATQFGEVNHKEPIAIEKPGKAGNGNGDEEIGSRVVFSLHPTGHKWVGTAASNGGPTNTELATAGNWERCYAERKQIKVSVLRTREA